MKRGCFILIALILMLPSTSALGDVSITEDELGIFSCLYMAQNVVNGMSQEEYADIGNNEPIWFIDYRNCWSGEFEPILDIYFTEHFYFSFWGEPVSRLELHLDHIFFPSSPIVQILIPEETDRFPFPIIDENAIQPNSYLEKATIHKKPIISTISQSEYEFLSVFLACVYLNPYMTPQEYIQTLADNEVPFEKHETLQENEDTITIISFSDKLSLKLISKENIEFAFIEFTYFDGKEKYCVDVPVNVEDYYFQYFDDI